MHGILHRAPITRALGTAYNQMNLNCHQTDRYQYGQFYYRHKFAFLFTLT